MSTGTTTVHTTYVVTIGWFALAILLAIVASTWNLRVFIASEIEDAMTATSARLESTVANIRQEIHAPLNNPAPAVRNGRRQDLTIVSPTADREKHEPPRGGRRDKRPLVGTLRSTRPPPTRRPSATKSGRPAAKAFGHSIQQSKSRGTALTTPSESPSPGWEKLPSRRTAAPWISEQSS